MKNFSPEPTPSLDPDLMALLERARASSRARDERRRLEGGETPEADPLHEQVEWTGPKPPSPAQYRACEARLDALRRRAQQGQFKCLPLAIGCEYPTLLTRLPIFRPSRMATQLKKLDVNGAMHFDSAWGRGVRKGPPMTTFDEDVLMALLRLRSHQLVGQGSHLPIALVRPGDHCLVHFTVCTVAQIANELSIRRGGKTWNRIIDSVKNLAALTIELDDKVHARYAGALQRGRSIRLFTLSWELSEDDGVFEIQFDPVMSHWLSDDRTFVDPVIRSKLEGRVARAVHRFLSSQSVYYETSLKRLLAAIGFDQPERKARPYLTIALDEIVATGWLAHYQIIGSGRASPLRLETFRQ